MDIKIFILKGVFSMGLDYYISLKAKNKKDNTEHTLDLCYWRKHWGLRDEIQNLIRSDENREYKISDDFPDDAITLCTTDILKPLIELLLELEKDKENSAWRHCIFAPIVARTHTLSQISELMIVDYFFDFFEREIGDEGELEFHLTDYDFLKSFLSNERNFDDYDFAIEFVNSY